MATHIQKINICSSKTSLLISVMPLVIFNANQSALITGANKNASKRDELLVKFLKNSKNIGFVISDDKAFTDDEEKLLSSHSKISVGNNWIQGHCVIAIIHHYIDQI